MIVRHLAWSPGVTVEPLDGNRCRIRSPRRELLTEPLSLAQKGALDTLKGTGVPEAAFLSPIAGVQSRMRLAMYRSEGVRLGLIQQALVADEQLTCGVVSIADRYRPEHELDIPSRPVLSRFTLLRPHGDHFVLESPLSLVQIHLYDQGCLAWLGFLLPGSSTSNELAAEASAQERALLEMLATANMLSNRLVDGRTEEETDETMRQWQFHDLYFHRPAIYDRPRGASLKARGARSAAKPVAARGVSLSHGASAGGGRSGGRELATVSVWWCTS